MEHFIYNNFKKFKYNKFKKNYLGHVCVHVHMCVEPVGGWCGGHRLTSDILLQTLCILLSGTGSLAGLELTSQARPASPSPKAVPASAFPVQRSRDCTMTSSFCTRGSRAQTQLLTMLARHALYQPNYLPSPRKHLSCQFTTIRPMIGSSEKQTHMPLSVELLAVLGTVGIVLMTLWFVHRGVQ